MEKGQQKLLKIGELARRAGITRRTIRYYEELGLLLPSERSQGGFRLYTEDDLTKLSFIKRFKELDFSLEEIKRLFDSTEEKSGKEKRISDSLNLLHEQLQRVEEEIKELNQTKTEIKKAIAALEKCKQCQLEECPPNCDSKEVML